MLSAVQYFADLADLKDVHTEFLEPVLPAPKNRE
jgi:hypothetical protein